MPEDSKVKAWVFEVSSFSYSKRAIRPDRIAWFDVHINDENKIDAVYIYLESQRNTEDEFPLVLQHEAAVAFIQRIQQYWDIEVVYEADNSGKQDDNGQELSATGFKPIPKVP